MNLQEDDPASMKVEELLALLRNDVMLDDIAQTCAVSDEVRDIHICTRRS